MNTPRRLITTSIAALMVLAPLLAAGQDAERSRTEGLKETDRFVKTGESTTKAVGEAKDQVKSTLDAYNALVSQPSTNMKGDYKKVMKSSDSMNDKVAEARKKIAEMETAGATYFSGRAATNKGISDAALQNKANQRLEASQKEFAGVLQQLRDAGGALEPFRKQLADQITYLGSDLTPSGTSSLKPQAVKLNAQGADVIAKTDAAIARANTYFQGLKAD